MSSNKNISIVSPNTWQAIFANIQGVKDFSKSDKLITWKKQVIDEIDVKKNPLRLLFTIKDEGDVIELSKNTMITYTFQKSEAGKYIKFYSYINEFKSIQQCEIFFVEDECNTDVRIRGVERVGSDTSEIAVGQKIKLKVNEYSVEEKKVSGSIKKNIKWMVKVGDNDDERLIIDGLVLAGDGIEFRVPDNWDNQEIILMPYLNIHTVKISLSLSVSKDLFRFYYTSDDFVLYNKERYLERSEQIIKEYKKINSELINQQVDFYYEDQIYKANSYATLFGRDGIFNFIGAFKNLYTLNKYEILYVIAHGAYVLFDYGIKQPRDLTVLNESVGINKLLDYKYEFYRIMNEYMHVNSLVIIDQIVYNANELGNYLWGMVLEYYGVVLTPNIIAELGTRGRDDEPWEQRAINAGRKKANTLIISEDEKQYIVDRRLDFRLMYNDKDKSWRELDLKKRN